MRWLREKANRLRGRPTCMVCGRHIPEVGMTCRRGMTLLGRGGLTLVDRKTLERRFGSAE